MKSLLGLPFVLIGIALYFLPAIIAYMRKYKNRMSVLVIDLFLGWTLIGWVVALALSFADDVEENEKQDEMMKNVLKIGGIIIGVLIILGIIGNLIGNVDTTSHSSYKKHASYLNHGGNKNRFLDKSSEEYKAALLFQPDKLLELDEEERKEILSNLTAEDVNKIYSKNSYINSNARDTEYGKTILMYASQYCKDPEVIEILIKHRADVKASEIPSLKTALMYACEYNDNPEIAETLIINGSSLIKSDENNYTALTHAACSNKNPEVFETLIAKGVPEYTIKDTLIEVSSHCENTEAMEILMKQLNLNKLNEKIWIRNGETLLMRASAMNENPKTIEFLIEKGFDVNEKDFDKKTSLMYASKNNNNPEIIDTLIKKGADINAKDEDGKTSLMYAIKYNHNLEIIDTLIRKGADINAKDEDDNTLLIYACEDEEYTKIIDVLMKNNFNINIADKNGKNALMNTYNGSLWKLDNENDVRLVLIERGIDINAKDNAEKTALMYACEFVKDINQIDMLLQYGADVNAKDKDGNTVYDYAKKNKNILYSKIKAVLDKYQDANNEN